MSNLNTMIFSLTLTIFVLAIILVFAAKETVCSSEDELPFTLNVDSYNYKAGEQFCIHIDNLSQ